MTEKKEKNEWIKFNNRFIRKNTIISYRHVGLTIEICTNFFSFNETFDVESKVHHFMRHLHDELKDS